MEKSEVTKGIHFQRGIYAVLRVLFGGLLCLITQHSAEKYKPKSDVFLLLANHSVDYDPMYAVIDTKSHMKFVAAANLTRGFGGWFIKNLAGPIPREKGASADSVVEAIKENLDAGISVAMYPEGITTWDGETAFISKRTARLVKDSKGGMVTFKTVGGYLRMPRWSVVKRRGKTYSHVVREYSREELDKMTVDEIYEAICKDLYVNAYDEQEKRHWKYDCKARAEGLEGALYVCPVCGKIGRLRSEGHKFFCECKSEWFYDDEGYLISDKEEYKDLIKSEKKISILDWSRWQKEYLHENAERLAAQIDTPICSTEQFKVFGDRIETEDGTYYFKDITAMSIFRATRLFFTCSGKHHEYFIDPKDGRVGQMYFALWRICTGKEYV